MTTIKKMSKLKVIAASAVALAMTLATASSTLAKPTPEEVAKLGVSGTELTPAGAIRAGNADGSIPEWKNEPIKPPAGFKPGTFHLDPFASDKILFTITAQNYKQYSDKLSQGHQKMFQIYPDYKMNIYPTHRSAVYPEYTYKSAIENASRAELIVTADHRIGFKNAIHAWPFPIPKDANEALMNEQGRPFPPYNANWENTLVTTSSGDFELNRTPGFSYSPWSDSASSIDKFDPAVPGKGGRNYRQVVIAPPKTAGEGVLQMQPAHFAYGDPLTWLYNSGQRRVKRSPQVVYDFAFPGSDGMATVDQAYGYSSAGARYAWTLEGRMEMYVPYNAYKLHSGDIKVRDMITKDGRLNQDLARYELHRVWKLTGNLREGSRHVYKKRSLYLDEDTWWSLISDNYDNRGEIWRLQELHPVYFYDTGFTMYTIWNQYDMQAGRMFATGVDNEDPAPDFTWRPPNSSFFTPGALRSDSKR